MQLYAWVVRDTIGIAKKVIEETDFKMEYHEYQILRWNIWF